MKASCSICLRCGDATERPFRIDTIGIAVECPEHGTVITQGVSPEALMKIKWQIEDLRASCIESESELTSARAQLAQVIRDRDALAKALEIAGREIENADGCIADADETLMEKVGVSISGYEIARKHLAVALVSIRGGKQEGE